MRCVLFLILLILSGCNQNQSTLTISAASDLKPAFEEIGQKYFSETNTRVTFNFGSSGHLAQQIETGAPVDLFASANISYINELDKKGLIASDTKTIYARGGIVIWMRDQSTLKIASINDLTQSDISRVSIANPDHAPYGMAAKQSLMNAGILDQVQPKLIIAENIAQAQQFAETGNTDVAITALSLSINKKNGKWIMIPNKLHKPIDQAFAVIKNSKNLAGAKRFAEYLKSESSRHIMLKYGFTIPEEINE